MTERFTAWRRPAVFALAQAGFAEGRLTGALTVSLDDGAGAETGTAEFVFAGPQDVRGLQPGVVAGRVPAPGTQDAEVTRVAHVELRDTGLPWRYTPQPNAAAGVRPWLVLVVAVTGVEVTLDGASVTLRNPALRAHPLATSAGWAHVHDLPGGSIARLLSPRPLVPDTAYTAVLVPAFTLPDGATTPRPAWADDTADVTLRCYDAWRFRTRDDVDDFRSIAQRLEPLGAAEEQALRATGFGRASTTVRGRPEPVLHLGGALSAVDREPPEPLPADVAAEVEALAALAASAGRWVLGLPRYDEPWVAPGTPVPAGGWRRQVRVDPRHRGAAGLGAWAAIAWQDRIADGAGRQAGALALLAERVRHLSLGLRASRSQWTRRVPADPLAALAVLAPMLARLPADGGAVVLDHLAGRTPRLVPALFSAAARRTLRPRTALARAAAPGATSLPALVESAATRCVPAPDPLPGQGDLADIVADPVRRAEARERLGAEGSAFLELALQPMPAGTREDPGRLPEVLDTFADDLLDRLNRGRVAVACRPLADAGALAGSVLGGVDPTVARPVAVGRVLDGFTGVRAPELAPPDLALELDIPLWSFLRDEAPDWLLPGGGDIPPDRVLAVQTNPEFVDAFLLGANHRALGELRWRNLPLVAGWTPLRRFWQRIGDGGGAPAPDVRPVLDVLTPPSPGAPAWTDASLLGDPAHQQDGRGASLVVVLHTELFRRYPRTLVSLVPNPGGAVTWQDDVENLPGARVWPVLSGTLHPELVFFGFPVPPAAGKDHWLVLEEPPPGFRFSTPTPAQAGMTNGAAYAAATLNRPIRALFGRLLG